MHATLNADSVPGTLFVATRLPLESAPCGRGAGTPSPTHVA
jgi:hypothetical protein